jgi:hypothetical protein
MRVKTRPVRASRPVRAPRPRGSTRTRLALAPRALIHTQDRRSDHRPVPIRDAARTSKTERSVSHELWMAHVELFRAFVLLVLASFMILGGLPALIHLAAVGFP